ncbi:hypothetical protein FVD15_04255 [Campylobacter volucris]|uniref:Uncharacterized protein n=1 Tax=Campylobacter volucris TaxID=1031542 RepID=A0AAE5YGN2_9BACT|nr:hypothetical protein [Campylobacter volucris]AJC94699.1 hypothetical protein CVOL_1405 [Campylobacter volucris LMG 24379]KAB0579405.1 hypothetical protein F7P61_04605 [Campylobacter volucris]QBL12957.1 hypothetical protein A9460_00890 [Campylobacter volucris]QEL08916.1 hypothetical protein CVOLT_1410 [Campylobacter volucris]TXK68994.1 hypothetical protein FVD15_04255 [Campylobacter volucris]
MDSWKKLEDLNLFEVQKRTQIEIACLELIIKKDFKSLSRFNINGFIKILQREYELDFTSFLEEYEAYLAENGVEKKNSAHVCPRMSSYTKEKSYFWFFVVIIVVALIILSALAVSRLLQDVADENTTNVLNQEQIIIEENDTNATILFNEKDFIEENSTDNNESVEEILDVNVSVQDENTSINENLIIEENAPKKAEALVNESVIKPSAELWLGMVDLKTFQKSSKTIKNEFVISLEKDMLITTGHAAFSLNDEHNNILEFKSGVSKFLMIKDGKIKQISKAEFIKENRGKLW